MDLTRKYLDMLKPAVDKDGEDAEFVDSYDQLLSRFAKVVCDAERHQVWQDATTVSSKKRRRAAGEKEKPTADEPKDADEEGNGRLSAESDCGSSEGSDADPWHKPSRGSAERPEPVKEQSSN